MVDSSEPFPETENPSSAEQPVSSSQAANHGDSALEEAQTHQLIDHQEYLAAVEAVLMVAEEPVTPHELAAALKVSEHQIVTLIDELRVEADGNSGSRERGFEIREIAGGFRYYSRLKYADHVSAFILSGQTARLSQAALETLAVIAYRQPVARSQVAAIRGVNVDGVVRTLMHRGLIDTVGTDPVTGATLYETTGAFLEKIGVDSLKDLPQLSPHLPGIEAATDFDDDSLGS